MAHRPSGGHWLAAVIAVLAFFGIASSAQAFIYWGNTGSTIGRANPDGSGANQSFITGANQPCGVAVDASHLFWANDADGTFGRANLDGSGTIQNLFSGADNPCGLAVDASHIYWSNTAPSGSLGRANLDGSSPDQGFIGSLSYPCGVAVDSRYIYWVNRDASSIGRANLDGSSPTVNFITTGAVEPCGVAVDAGHVYWTDLGGTTIGRANIDGGSPNGSFITGASRPCGVAVDANSVYWANSNVGTIGRANLDGSGVNQSIVSGANIPCFVAADVPPPPPPPPVVPTVLAITDLHVAPGAFPAARQGASIVRRHRRSTGATVSYKDSQAATARLTLFRVRSGVKRNGKCVAAPRPRHKHHRTTRGAARRQAKRCVRYVRAGSFSHADASGPNSFHFTGRVGGHSLQPGRYRLRAVPVLGAQTGGSDTSGFRIKP
jgi:streptogramin lyase